MAQELSIRTVPWVWLAFTLFLIVYIGGFIPTDKPGEHFYLTAFSICLTLSYFAAFAELHEAMRIKRLFTYIAQENWRRSAEELPLWTITFVLATLLALPLSFDNVTNLEELHIYPVTILLLLLRDIGIFLFFSYSKNPQRAFSLTLLTLILLYGMFPGIFTAIKQQWLTAIFLPLIAENMLLSLVYGVAQCALVWYLLYQRWQDSV
jgi:predicted membrane protein